MVRKEKDSFTISKRFERFLGYAVVASILAVLCISPLCYGAKEKPVASKVPSEPNTPLADICKQKGVDLPLKNARMTVDKKAKKLRLYSWDVLLKTYPVAFGAHPEGPKTEEGDSRTPEGKYYLIKHNSPAFGKCFYIAYPNANDARTGLNKGLITRKEYERITAAVGGKGYPPSNTRLGGQILLHGTKDRSDQKLTTTNWTLGCIAMENAHIIELLNAMPDSARPELLIAPSFEKPSN